ncbi:MAG: hypothetical protein IAG13_33900 [Deltaproteobacteria bacterium]|nr:hypothetical protein [Nannocystaceae bacterium]
MRMYRGHRRDDRARLVVTRVAERVNGLLVVDRALGRNDQLGEPTHREHEHPRERQRDGGRDPWP